MLNYRPTNPKDLIDKINTHPVFIYSSHTNIQMKELETLICEYFMGNDIMVNNHAVSFLDYADSAFAAIRRAISSYNNSKGLPMAYIYSAVRNTIRVEEAAESFSSSHGGIALTYRHWSIIQDLEKNPLASDAEIASMGKNRTRDTSFHLRHLKNIYSSSFSLEESVYDDDDEPLGTMIPSRHFTDERLLAEDSYHSSLSTLFQIFDSFYTCSRSSAKQTIAYLTTVFCLSHLDSEDISEIESHPFYSLAAAHKYHSNGNKLTHSEIAFLCDRSNASVSHIWKNLQGSVYASFIKKH